MAIIFTNFVYFLLSRWQLYLLTLLIIRSVDGDYIYLYTRFIFCSVDGDYIY